MRGLDTQWGMVDEALPYGRGAFRWRVLLYWVSVSNDLQEFFQ
jgi:hypothetical protein